MIKASIVLSLALTLSCTGVLSVGNDAARPSDAPHKDGSRDAGSEGVAPSDGPQGEMPIVDLAPDPDSGQIFSPGTPKNLTASSSADDQNPLWSPDGSQLAFTTKRANGNFDVWLMIANGQSPKAITNLPGHDAVNLPGSAWCASKGLIVYSSDSSGQENLWTIKSDGSGAQQVYGSSNLDREPTWSPTCDRITFQSRRSGNWDIYVVGADGSNLKRLTNDSADDWAPNWSPKSEEIVFQSKRSGTWKLWTIRADGSGLTQRTTGGSEDTDMSWSPDGKQLVYSTDLFGAQAHIAILELKAGAKPRQVTTGSAYDGAPAWSPDGQRIAFESDRTGNLDIWVVELYQAP